MPSNHVDRCLTSTNTASAWRKATRCASGACVEVRATAAGVQVRDSKQPDGPVLTFTGDEWADVVAGIKDGYMPDGFTKLLTTLVGGVQWEHDGRRLTFTDREWLAFCDGVDNGEFDLERLTTGTGQDPAQEGPDTESRHPGPVRRSTALPGASNDAPGPIAEKI